MIEKYRPFISCNNLALRIQHSQGTNMLTSIQHIKGDLSRVDNEMRGRQMCVSDWILAVFSIGLVSLVCLV